LLPPGFFRSVALFFALLFFSVFLDAEGFADDTPGLFQGLFKLGDPLFKLTLPGHVPHLPSVGTPESPRLPQSVASG